MSGAHTTRHPRHGRGEQGLVLFLTILVLAPMLTFAAYAVDLSSWHARMTHLQEAADAAALAGTVWMPNIAKATQVAGESLARNDIVDGTDDISVSIGEGSTPTSLRVTVVDHSARRFFSTFMGGDDQELTRFAEAEYFLPLPLGSPLNYFGGDRTKTGGADTTTITVVWPQPYNNLSRPPAGPFGCNVGTSSGQGLGYWGSAGSYSSTGFGGSSPQCRWTAATAATSADPGGQVPTNVPCNRQQSPTSSLGRWNTGLLGALHSYTSTNRHTSGTGNRQCLWATPGTQPLDASTRVPLNAPCNVTGNLLDGSWNDLLGIKLYLGLALLPAPLCQWNAIIDTVVTPFVNPIAEDRSPGFWAQVEGPGTVAAYGDAFSSRCAVSQNCSTVQSAQHRSTGYWYVIRVPAGATAPITVSVFDALFRRDGTITQDTGDYNLNPYASMAANPSFTTEFRLYRQTNPLSVTERQPVGTALVPDQADNSCWWAVTSEPEFAMQWKPLCTIQPSGGPSQTYLLNVRSYNIGGGQGSGLNGYAVEAVAATGPQPALYAYSDMGMFNNGSGTFYLAEVAPHFAGKVLAIDLWDSGDVSSGTATIYPRMPSQTAPKPVADAPATCTYTSGPEPNAVNGGSPTWGNTGVRYDTPQPSDDSNRCAVRTAPAGTSQRFNDEWLRIRIQIPSDYTCTVGLNPETTAGSCWWGIAYDFSAQPFDVTTWKARIEGNPVHLTR